MRAALDWAAPGVECGIVDADGMNRSRPRVTMTTVERVTKTQVVLANGTRFMRDSGRKVGNATAWTSPDLYPAGHPALARAREIAMQQHIDRLAKHLANVGLDLMDVRELALFGRRADAAQSERAERVLKVVGTAFAPAPSTEPEDEHAWIKEKQR